MSNYYTIFWATLETLASGYAQAQAPVLTGITPLANARAAARTSPLIASFSQPLLAASSGALKVYSAQHGGLRSRGGTPATVSGNTLRYTPPASRPRLPGETVNYTITKAAAGSNGGLANARVGQFTTAVSNPGGFFYNRSTTSVTDFPGGAVLGDIDGDGDLDLVTANATSFVSVRLNGGNANGGGTGGFAAGYDLYLGAGQSLSVPVLGDVDGDGDLDLVVTHYEFSGTISVRLNGGDASGSNTGIFSNGADFGGVSTYTINAVLGDIDGDGDLDLLTTHDHPFNNLGPCAVNVFLNGGDATGSNSGTFTYASVVSVGAGAGVPVLGDIDGDGDLDLAVTNRQDATVSLLLNGGDATGSNTGVFSGGSLVSVPAQSSNLALGDIDGDNDLDLLVSAPVNARYWEGLITVLLNGGNASGSSTGIFSNGSSIYLANRPGNIVLNDLDADGDLDLLVLNDELVSLRLNGGDASGSNTGVFSPSTALNSLAREVPVGATPGIVITGDVDADGDLDLVVTHNKYPGSVSTHLNGGTVLAARATQHAAWALYPNPTRTTATLTGGSPHAAVQVLDVLGRVVLTTQADATGIAHIPPLPTGVYSVCSTEQVLRLLME